jgi:hypothetical protein
MTAKIIQFRFPKYQSKAAQDRVHPRPSIVSGKGALLYRLHQKGTMADYFTNFSLVLKLKDPAGHAYAVELADKAVRCRSMEEPLPLTDEGSGGHKNLRLVSVDRQK